MLLEAVIIITSAACIVEIDGKRILWPCHRHSDPLVVFSQMYPVGYAKMLEQGFMDEKRNFISREDAFNIASNNGQLLERPENGYHGDKLFSEDLW